MEEDGYAIGAFITGAITFCAVWVFCSMEYGFLGFALGWLPALIVAGIVGVLWGLLVCLAVIAVAVFFLIAS